MSSLVSRVISNESEFKRVDFIMATGLGEFLRNLRQGLVKADETTRGEAQKGKTARAEGARR